MALGAEATLGLEAAREYIASVRWQFAKTMPQWPHEYTVRRWRPDKSDEFSAFVELIKSEGEVKPWPPRSSRPRHHHIYLTVDGWQYWIMDPVDLPVEQVELVNRAEVALPTSA